jgi:hypothetical protein
MFISEIVFELVAGGKSRTDKLYSFSLRPALSRRLYQPKIAPLLCLPLPDRINGFTLLRDEGFDELDSLTGENQFSAMVAKVHPDTRDSDGIAFSHLLLVVNLDQQKSSGLANGASLAR